MAWMEKNEISQDVLQNLLNEFAQILASKYEQRVVETEHGDVHCFIDPHGNYIYPAFMFGGVGDPFHFLVVEYAENEDEIKKAWEDEGGQFFPEDYESKEAMFEAMLKEIEG